MTDTFTISSPHGPDLLATVDRAMMVESQSCPECTMTPGYEVLWFNGEKITRDCWFCHGLGRV